MPAWLAELAAEAAALSRAAPLACGTTTSAASAGVMPGYSVLTTTMASTPPTIYAPMNDGAEAGAMPANVLENIRPIVIAGLAKLAEEVKK